MGTERDPIITVAVTVLGIILTVGLLGLEDFLASDKDIEVATESAESTALSSDSSSNAMSNLNDLVNIWLDDFSVLLTDFAKGFAILAIAGLVLATIVIAVDTLRELFAVVRNAVKHRNRVTVLEPEEIKELQESFSSEKSPFIFIAQHYTGGNSLVSKAINWINQGKVSGVDLKPLATKLGISASVNKDNVEYYELVNQVGTLLKQFIKQLRPEDCSKTPNEQVLLDAHLIKELVNELDTALGNTAHLELDMNTLQDLKQELEKSIEYQVEYAEQVPLA